jgi:hypothetical protein
MVKSHLNRMDPAEINVIMVNRLEALLQSGGRLAGGDKNFYLHELAERTLMGRGVPYDPAHAAALAKYRISPFAVYAAEAVRQVEKGSLASGFYRYWGIERK